MSVAEAWTQTPESTARYVRPDELHQAFNFAWLLAPWSATAFRDVVTNTLDALEHQDSSPTWVLSNHDVTRHMTRYGGGAQGLARARAATLTMLALPGSSYLYQGEELGLPEVDVAPAYRQDPSWFRTGEPGRDGCRVPLPWSGDRRAVRLRSRRRAALDPAARRLGGADRRGADRRPDVHAGVLPRGARRAARRGGDGRGRPGRHRADGGRAVLRPRPRHRARELRHEPRRRCPAGAVLVASGPLEDGMLPPDTAAWVRRRPERLAQDGRVERPVVATERLDEDVEVLLGPVAEPLVEPLATVVAHLTEARLRPRRSSRSPSPGRRSGSGLRSTSPRSTRCCTWRLIAPLSIPNASTITEDRVGPTRRGAPGAGTPRAAGPRARPGPAPRGPAGPGGSAR